MAEPRAATAVRVVGRAALLTLAVVSLGYRCSDAIVARVLPVIRAEILLLDHNLEILSLELSTEGISRTIRLHANLDHPVYLADRSIYPVGWWPYSPKGFYQVEITVASVLQAPVLLCIVILSWPHRSLRELLLRPLAAIPLAALLFALDAPLELIGNFHSIVFLTDAPRATDGYFAWDRFLEGGGRPMLALAFAALAIVAGQTLDRGRPFGRGRRFGRGSAVREAIGAPELIVDDGG